MIGAFFIFLMMAISFNPGSSVPEPDESLLSDPFFLLIECQGCDILAERYDYIANLLEEEFEDTYMKLFKTARLHYEIVNMVSLCTKTLKNFDFPRRAASQNLKKAIAGIIINYLDTQ